MIKINEQFDGQSLVFLVSQPRAGSTLLQRLLSTHKNIHSVPEPWLMFSSIYAVRETGHCAEYDSSLCAQAINNFIETLPSGKETYINGLRYGYGYIYNEALLKCDKTLFLDKTPRYYEILNELVEIFPNAKVIILIRNPLAVLNSILKTWVKKNLMHLARYRRDLLVAPKLMMRFVEERSENVFLIHYEDLVQTPKKVLISLCHFLSIEYSDDLLIYSNTDHNPKAFGDKDGIMQFNTPEYELSVKWKEELSHNQEQHFAIAYIKELGRELIQKMGYSYDELINAMGKEKRTIGIVPWSVVINDDNSINNRIKTRAYQFLIRLKSKYCSRCLKIWK